MKTVALILVLTHPVIAQAEIVVPARTIRAKEVILVEDLTQKQAEVPNAVTQADDLIGMEARVTLYAGRPIRLSDVGPPALVDRNDLVTILFDHGALSIATDGRALGRGAEGEFIRVMNLSSRTTVTGRIRPDGSIEVK